MKTVYRIQSTVVLASGSDVETDDHVVVNGGMLTAAEKVKTHHLKLRYRDPKDGEWSDVVDVIAHHGNKVCDLTC